MAPINELPVGNTDSSTAASLTTQTCRIKLKQSRNSSKQVSDPARYGKLCDRFHRVTVVAVAGAFKASIFCLMSQARPLISGSLLVFTTVSNDLLTALATP